MKHKFNQIQEGIETISKAMLDNFKQKETVDDYDNGFIDGQLEELINKTK